MKNSVLYVLYDPDLREQPVLYSLRTLLNICGATCQLLPLSAETLASIPRGAPTLTYCDKPLASDNPELHIKSCGLFERKKYLLRESLPEVIQIVDGIKYLYGDLGIERNVVNDRRLLSVQMDPIASAFFFLTGYDELVQSSAEDKRGRRPLEGTFIGKNGLTERPWVNLYARQISDWLGWVAPDLKLRQHLWGKSNFALVVTRDIDSVRHYQGFDIRKFARALATGSGKSVQNQISDTVRYGFRILSDKHNNLESIIDWERSEELTSSFYFMTSDLIGDANYRLDELIATHPIVKSAMENGWEAGFHPGYRTFLSPVAFLEEQARFREVFPGSGSGGRQHGLRFRYPYTWRLWEDNGFLYDSSIGYAEREGFRSGCCTPYKTFDLLEDRTMNLWELPLTVMDCTLDKYRLLSSQQRQHRLRTMADEVKGVGGMFMLLWHNSYFGLENIGAYHSELSEFCLEIRDSGAAIMTSAKALEAWVRPDTKLDRYDPWTT